MAFLVFDIETRIDKRLLNECFFAGRGLSDAAAWENYREQLRARRGSDFAPLTLHVPISIAVGQVSGDYALRAVESLALTGYSEERLVREFWTRAEALDGALVSFNGRRFDLPVLELGALRHGLQIPAHFAEGARARLSETHHLDLFDLLTNYGAAPLAGGMNLLLRMIGMPGKRGVAGGDVQAMFEAGRLEEIHRYCRSDVIQTYFLFIRVELMRGRLDPRGYERARAASTHFLAELGPGDPR